MKYIFLYMLLSFLPNMALCNDIENSQSPEYDFILDYKIEDTEAYKTLMTDYEWDLNHLKISGDMYDNPNVKYYLDKMSSEDKFTIEETFIH